MTIGVSKETLEDWEQSGYEPTMRTLLAECKELNPWLPIDENTPMDKNLLVYFDDGSTEVARNCDGTWLDNDNLDFDYGATAPTHWQELSEDPKEE